jgi:formylglycine-generating enzyme required for sulfatase activity
MCIRDSSTLNSTQPVGLKQENGYGLFDLTGNVWEWTNDDYDNPGEYRPGAGRRVIRGGGWYYFADVCHVAFREWVTPDGRYDDLGLRLSRSL